MKTVRLGSTDLWVSRVGFGGIPIQRLSEADALAVIRRALDAGFTFFDTAHGYTTSEERIGKAIAGRRDQLVITTKTPAKDKKTALEHLDLSLRRLQTDYIDLWQLHNVSTPKGWAQVQGPNGALEAANAAVQSGKVRYVGVSSHSLDLSLVLVPTGHFRTLQFPFNFVTDEPTAALLPLTVQHSLGFIAMKPFAGGLLDNARLTIKHLLQYPTVVPDPGMQSTAEVDEIAAIVNDPLELTPDELQEMERIRAAADARFCRRCEYCQPCPENVRIATVMTVQSFWRRFPPERFFGGFIKEAAESARRCAECGECETRCPYHLPIREMLAENLAFYDRMFAASSGASTASGVPSA